MAAASAMEVTAAVAHKGTRQTTPGARLLLPVDLMLVNYRTRVQIHKAIQMTGGLLVLLVVVVCVATLATHQPNKNRRNSASIARRLEGRGGGGDSMGSLSNPVSGLQPILRLDDVFISVKTASKFHFTRLPPILKTWYNTAPRNTFFFTDADDEELSKMLGDNLVATPCPPDHSRHALVCKMQHEFNAFLQTDKKWFCHFDDDQYVNVGGLVRVLRRYQASQAWYLGKPSLEEPLQILDRADGDVFKEKKLKFWFATGGAGFCLSRPLAARMKRLAGRRNFISASERMRLPDDVTMGYIVEKLAGVPLTRVPEFHSHLESLALVADLANQISFSYGDHGTNLVEVEGFTLNEDPTRFLSIHCHLHPETEWCPRRRRRR